MNFNDKVYNNDLLEETKIYKDEPSGLLKKGLTYTAKKMLTASKKVVNKIISPYRPPISIQCFTNKDDIIRYIENSLKSKSRDIIELRDIALNSIYTINLAKKLNDELIIEYHQKVDVFKNLFSEDQKSDSKTEETEIFQQAMKEIKIIKLQLDEKSLFRKKYDFLQTLSESPNDYLTLSSKFNSLEQKYPDWDNPVIAEYVVKNIPDLSSNKKIIFMLLSYYPTDTNYLKLAEKISIKEDSVIFTEMIKVFS